ncbi:hypothetical protein [Shewanella aestuarii]|uniref:Rap1a immunity protein domain-containing protein n=1 Tax=Shewanella aestuarii TaxID=1028752 RepID=A0A6G9QL38_9GAMM|nr:hypothetical protein [Shewanella aestuarii]QIR15246.1 hypothetical protein HBH39_12755 [Shewanella aestuarii]
MNKLSMVALIAGVSVFALPAKSESFNVCLLDANSQTCQAYLEGIVDGAMMYRIDKANNFSGNDYESRALKYRAGKRYQKANSKYCSTHEPVKADIVAVLVEQVSINNVANSDDLELVINSLLDCSLKK